MREMKVGEDKKTFVGPCCIKADPTQLFENSEFHYGLEISSHMGVKAYATYGGLTIEFKKSREEIQEWLSKSETPVEQDQESSTPDIVTSAKPVDQKEMPN